MQDVVFYLRDCPLYVPVRPRRRGGAGDQQVRDNKARRSQDVTDIEMLTHHHLLQTSELTN